MISTYLTIGIPSLMVLVGILLNRNDANRLDARITAEIGSVRNDIGSLRADIASLRAQSHSDLVLLLQHDKEQDARIIRLEARAR